MTISILSSTIDGDSQYTVTTDPFDTRGASLIVPFVIGYGNSITAITDSQSNAWDASTQYTSAYTVIRSFRKAAPSTSATHTFTYTYNGSTNNALYPCMGVVALAGTHATPYDSIAGDDDGSPGPLTPTENNCIVLAFCDKSSAGDASVDDGFTELQELALDPSSYYGGVLAYKIQAAAVSANPTFSGVTIQTSLIIAFRAEVVGGVASGKRILGGGIL